MRDLSELNINEGGKPVCRPAPTRSMVEEFERQFELKLPPEYLALLAHANGGHPELDSFLRVGGPSADGWAVNRFYHLDVDTASTDGLWWNMRVWRPVLGIHALPIANTGGGDVFFLDLRINPAPVKVCIHDENYRTIQLASSLEAFLDALIIDPDYI